MAIQPVIIEPLIDIVNSLNKTFLRVVAAILIFLLGFVLGKVVGRIIYKMLKEVEINKFLKTATGMRINADHLISNIVSYAIYFLSLVAALEQIGIANIILYLLSATIILVILLSFFLSIRDFLPNLISGIYLYSRANLKEGSYIELNGIKGELLQIDLFQVKIKTKQGDIFHIPNSVVAKSKIKVRKRKP